jgi:hypothetical protein
LLVPFVELSCDFASLNLAEEEEEEGVLDPLVTDLLDPPELAGGGVVPALLAVEPVLEGGLELAAGEEEEAGAGAVGFEEVSVLGSGLPEPEAGLVCTGVGVGVESWPLFPLSWPEDEAAVSFMLASS